jgi:hypothetical protein
MRLVEMSQLLTTIAASDARATIRRKSDLGEPLLRAVQGCALLALAFRGYNPRLDRVAALLGTIRYGKFAFDAVHDGLDSCTEKDQDRDSGNLLKILNLTTTLCFLHDQGLLNLGEHYTWIERGMNLSWFAYAALASHEALRTLTTNEGGSSEWSGLADGLLYMPAAIFLDNGPFKGAALALSGAVGFYATWQS